MCVNTFKLRHKIYFSKLLICPSTVATPPPSVYVLIACLFRCSRWTTSKRKFPRIGERIVLLICRTCTKRSWLSWDLPLCVSSVCCSSLPGLLMTGNNPPFFCRLLPVITIFLTPPEPCPICYIPLLILCGDFQVTYQKKSRKPCPMF